MDHCCVLGPVLKSAVALRTVPEAPSEHKRPKEADFEFWWMWQCCQGQGKLTHMEIW